MLLRKVLNLDFAAIYLAVAYSFLINYGFSLKTMGYAEIGNYLYAVAYAFAIIVVVIFIRKIIHLKFKSKMKMSLFFAILGSFVVLSVLSGELTMVGAILAVLMGVLASGANDRRIVKYLLISISGWFLFSLLLGVLGLSAGGNVIDTPLFGSKENTVELFAFGLRNPNVAARFFIPIALCLLYLYHRKTSVVLGIAITSVIVGYTTGSTMSIFVLLLSVLIFMSIGKDSTRKIIRKLAPYSFLISTILVFGIAILFGFKATLPNEINTALTGRPYAYGLRVENGSYLNLFGNNDAYSTLNNDDMNNTLALDNMPLYTMVFYGLIVYAMYFFLYYKAGKIIKDDRILAMGVILSIVMLTEKNGLVIDNIYIIFAVKYVFNNYFNKEMLYEKA